ncbi:DUF975 family protein [Dehalobacter sp. DCM]|uniref:DUF975 family protein n=1 Tax=Dehalobacter sp. DCM TaxID=2907827 RepID=UPI003082117E|nr:DUF975 family protein [Dehalobacter sp. DCM]
MLENSELRALARSQLKGNWAKPILAFLIYSAITAIFAWISNDENAAASLISLLITGPFMVGASVFSLAFSRQEDPGVGVIFDGFKSFLTSLGMYLWVLLWVILWSLLLIIPGIVKSYGYLMSFYILADNRQIGIRNALDLSKRISYGYRGKLFLLYLSFIGWAVLSILTAGIGFIWLIPYVEITIANFYNDLKRTSIENGICVPEDFNRDNYRAV